MRAPPSALLAGETRPYWEPAEVQGSPFGPLFCAICPTDPPDSVLELLLPVEREFAGRLEPSQRRREWLGGRLCLATALARFASSRAPLLAMASGAPVVPAGTSGSISHKGPLMAALAAQTPGGVGIDIECADERDTALEGKVLTAAERSRLKAHEGVAALYVAAHFSVKEAVYKALDRAEQEDLEFEDVEVALLAPLTPRGWIPATARVRGGARVVRVSLIFDGAWMIATAIRS